MMRVGLVLGAGGEPGGVYLRAALAAITRHTGWHPSDATTVVGTSAGALNGARLTHDLAGRSSVDDPRLALEALCAALAPPEPSVGDRVVAPLRRAGAKLLTRFGPAGSNAPGYEPAPPPYHPGLHVVSVRRPGGHRRIARLVEADDPRGELYASAAVPGWARPVLLDGVPHIDGAVHSPTNADLVSPDDHDVLVVIAPMVALDGGPVVARSHRAVLLAELAAWRRTGRPVALVAPTAEQMATRVDTRRFGAAATARIDAAFG